MQAYFLRHPETDWNARNIVYGKTDAPLNQDGISKKTPVFRAYNLRKDLVG